MADEAMNRVLADFESQRMRNRTALEARLAHAVSLCPAISELEDARLALLYNGDIQNALSTKAALQALLKKRGELLQEAGLPRDYLNMTYRCSVCRDSGFTGETVKQRCACFIKRLGEERFAPNDTEILQKQSFENFDLNKFPDEIPPDAKTSQREYMRQLRNICREYADVFPRNKKPNLLFYGQSGLGKTYLLNCITGALLRKSFNVLRFTAFSLGELCFQKHLGADIDLSHLSESDLLVCDDLGSEPLYNNVTIEYFFSIFNERLLRAKHTIVATNLSPQNIQERYGERIVSRLLDAEHTHRFHLRGRDIRTY
ncbi:MAG: ATP-binding protein [Bacillota bacterium]